MTESRIYLAFLFPLAALGLGFAISEAFGLATAEAFGLVGNGAAGA